MGDAGKTEHQGVIRWTSLQELDRVLDRARSEKWDSLALVSDSAYRPPHVSPARTFYLQEGLGDRVAALATLTGLTSLDLRGNQIGAEGARALGHLTGLTSLDLRGNQIGDEGARALGQLTGLTLLDLHANQIGDEGARALGQLTRLTSLDLSENQVGDEGTASLLDALSTSRSLTRLRLDEASPILPGEVLGTGDAQAILAAYRRYRDARKQAALRPLNEGKVLVVGNEAVGKTSLIRALVQRTPCDPNEQKTAGTAIHEKIEVSAWSPERSELTLNVWDFGGQEIMRGTHRFFLTERSLYLLVLEDRRQDDRSIFTWLETIEQRGGDSPVLVVINKSDGLPHQLQLDEPALQRDHPAIVGFVRTSCRDSPTAIASIAALRARIVATINRSERLTHVRDSIPLTWLRVKDAIAALARERSVLPVREFERLCEEGAADERVMDKAEQRGLLGLLHDLGVVVAHGLRRDATAALREVTVLDPNWLTGAIYALINSPAVRNDGGELHYEQLPELLDLTRYPPERYELILTMMQDPAFGLCIPIAGGRTHRYLLPDAVPTREPDCGHWPDDALRFRFQYSIVPVDLMPRFIAEAHLILTDRPTWWKAGVVLGAEGCRILVRVEPTRQRVEILVDGTTGKLAALGIVRNYLNAVHSRYAKLDVKAKVPLPDQPEVDVSYDHLVKLEERYGLEHSFDPEGAQRAYRVRELIEGVRHDRSWDRSEGSMSRDPGDRDERDDRRDRASHTDRTISIHASGGSTVTVAAPMTVAEGAVGVASEASASTPEPQGRPWWQVAAGSAVAAVVLAVVIYLLPTNHWRMLVGGLTTLALIVFVVVLRRDPAGFYRRALSYVIVAGVGINALGFTFDAFVKHPSAEGRMTFQSATSDWFFPAWAVIVIALVFGDLRTRLPRR